MNKDKAPDLKTPPNATLTLPGQLYAEVLASADMAGSVKTCSVYRNLVFRGKLQNYPEAAGLNLVRDMLKTLAGRGLVRRVRNRPALWTVVKRKVQKVYDSNK